MGFQYSQDAIDDAYRLYLRYNGGQLGRIVAYMREKWSDRFSASTILRWAEEYNWQEQLRLKAAETAKAGLTGLERLIRDIRETREVYSNRVRAGTASRDDKYLHRDFAGLEKEAYTQLKESAADLEHFVLMWEYLLEILPGISVDAYRHLLEVADEVQTTAAKRYGATKRPA